MTHILDGYTCFWRRAVDDTVARGRAMPEGQPAKVVHTPTA